MLRYGVIRSYSCNLRQRPYRPLSYIYHPRGLGFEIMPKGCGVADLAANHSSPFSLSRYPAPIWLGTRRDLPQPGHWVELTGASAFMHLLIARTPGLWHHENRLAAGLDIGVGKLTSHLNICCHRASTPDSIFRPFSSYMRPYIKLRHLPRRWSLDDITPRSWRP
jgi:hypothetical protein